MKRNSECTVNVAIAEFLEKNRLKEGVTKCQIAGIWRETVGNAIAKYTKRTELNNNKLTVYTASPIVRKELMMLKTEILEQINKKIGQNLVREIEIK
jgi:predicted nucleic acid-binding Zn ribbon protein